MILRVLIPEEIVIDFQMPETGQIKPRDTKREFPDASMETGMTRNERPPEEKKQRKCRVISLLTPS